MVSLRKTGIAYLIVILLALAVVVRIVDIQFIHKPVDKSTIKKIQDTVVLECTRGSILAADGRYLAFSIPEYRLAMDPCQAVDTVFENGIKGLSKNLADFYGDKSAAQYEKTLRDARNSGTRFLYVNRKLLTYQEMQKVSDFPILKKGQRRGGVRFEKIDHRTYPYGRLAFRTLGYLKDPSLKPVIGLEGSCDSILRGTPGRQPVKLTEGGYWIPDYERETIPPDDGCDVQTTLDINLQDVAQNALTKILGKTDELHAGTVVLMEVATGEIKAMVNLEKDGEGGFDETLNYAIGRKGEPGSVFKAATLTCLLEDGLVTLDTEIPATVNWKYGPRTYTDNYLKNYDRISVRRGFEISSNNVFRILAATNYDTYPDKFLNELTEERRITKDFPFEIAGFAPANLKSTESRSWNMSDLPQIAMGYTVEITPLHTLNYYNAIAGGGVMVKPHLIKNIQKYGKIIKNFGIDTLGRICSPSTAATLHEAMRGVVAHEGGTGYRVFKGCPLEVAGKTGTARIVFPGTGRYEDRQGNKMHQATFVGFFPYSSPKYSMIVVVYSEPTKSNFYGATWGGPVFREIVENIYASSLNMAETIPATGTLPERKVKNMGPSDTVPDVKGIGLRDAMLVLEGRGWKVTFTGTGKVAEQKILDEKSKRMELILK